MLLADKAKILEELFHIGGPDKKRSYRRFPCQDLTFAGNTSKLEVTGERSKRVNVFFAANDQNTSSVDYCDLSKFPSCCEYVDVFCLFEALECWLECCAQLCSDTGVSSFVFAW